MAKKARYSKTLVDDVVSLIKEDSYTIAEICKKVGISERSFYNWRDQHAEFAEAIKKAEDEFRDRILVECEKSLVKLIKGYTVQEKKTVVVDSKDKDPITKKPIPKIKEQTVTDKHIQPSLGAIIHYQTNNDPDRWRNRQSTELTGKDGKDLIPARVLTKEEASEFLKKLEDEC